MLCERCKQNAATVQYTYSVNGKGVSYSLCGQCYHQLSGAKSKQFADFLFPMGGISPATVQDREKICDLCGYTARQIQKEGRVGCARCYDIFRQELSEVIAQIHGNKRHVRGATENVQVQPSLMELLEKAIKEENYEQAAILRDKIKAQKEERS